MKNCGNCQYFNDLKNDVPNCSLLNIIVYKTFSGCYAHKLISSQSTGEMSERKGTRVPD